MSTKISAFDFISIYYRFNIAWFLDSVFLMTNRCKYTNDKMSLNMIWGLNRIETMTKTPFRRTKYRLSIIKLISNLILRKKNLIKPNTPKFYQISDKVLNFKHFTVHSYQIDGLWHSIDRVQTYNAIPTQHI